MVAELWSRDFAFRSGGSATLSVIGRLPKRDGNDTIMRFGFPWGWSMLLTFGKFCIGALVVEAVNGIPNTECLCL